MLTICWSVKGGVGTSVVAASLALAAGRRAPGALLVDLGGDQPTLLGVADPPGPGLAGWMAAGEAAPPDALGRLARPVGRGCHLLTRGAGRLGPERGQLLAALLAADGRAVVVDAGSAETSQLTSVLASAAQRSLLVVRPCVVGLARCRQLPAPVTGVVVVRDPGRPLGQTDIEAVVGAPVVADLAVDPAVARAADAGLAAHRWPRSYALAVGRVA